MNYKASHLAGFVGAAVVLTAGALWLLATFIDVPALQEFFLNRSKVQWITLGVFFFIFSVLSHRVFHYVQLCRALGQLPARASSPVPVLPPIVASRWSRVTKCQNEKWPAGRSSM